MNDTNSGSRGDFMVLSPNDVTHTAMMAALALTGKLYSLCE
jgi:hypothetical protein